jgi:DDE superfamily endonuclease
MKMKVLGVTTENVCNFDQTNVFFSPEAKRTLASKGCKQVSALRGESTQRCTVMLGCTANGEKFDPYVIFKGKNTAKGRINRRLQQVDQYRLCGLDNCFGFETSNYYAVQEKAWMESRLVADWLKNVFQPWAY